jgi:hypothetical protein
VAVGHGVVVVCVRERFVSLKRELTAVGVLHAREHVEGWEFSTPRYSNKFYNSFHYHFLVSFKYSIR